MRHTISLQRYPRLIVVLVSPSRQPGELTKSANDGIHVPLRDFMGATGS